MRSAKDAHQRAKGFRKAMSPPEVRLWTRLRQLRGGGPTFRRQHPIGPYIADFYCAAAKLVVEVDGAHHTEDAQIAHDAERSAYLESLGYRVVRCPGRDVMANADEAAQGIVQAAIYWIKQRRSGETPPPSRR
jgi:very-short-patch-repair endonuclease